MAAAVKVRSARRKQQRVSLLQSGKGPEKGDVFATSYGAVENRMLRGDFGALASGVWRSIETEVASRMQPPSGIRFRGTGGRGVEKQRD